MGCSWPRIVAAVHAWRSREVAVTRDDVEQLAAGILAVMDATAAGDLAPRDEYLATVIPGVQSSTRSDRSCAPTRRPA